MLQAETSERLEGPSRSSNGHNLYMMELYRDTNHSDLLSFDDGPALVSFDDKIYVRTWIESGRNNYNESYQLCIYTYLV